MTVRSFEEIPDHARLWVVAASDALPDAHADALLTRVDEFLDGWHAHGHPVVGARDWRHDRFLLIAADEEATGVSGCSIDSLFRVLRETERDLSVTLLDSSRVWFRDANGEIRSTPRSVFRQLVQQGEVTQDTVVFDNTVSSVGALRSGGWEKPLRESWHAKAFPIAAAR